MTDSAFPHLSINVAMTADGKIALENNRFMPFGSEHDRDLLLRLRARADAVIVGAGTVNSFPMDLGPGPERYRKLRRRFKLAEYNLRIVVSGQASLNPSAAVFKHRFSPIILLTSRQASKRRINRLIRAGAIVEYGGDGEIDFESALRVLKRKYRVRRLLCEGGGTLNDSLIRAGLVDEINLTICPFIFGGTNNATFADGLGAPTLAGAAQFKIRSARAIGREMFVKLTR